MWNTLSDEFDNDHFSGSSATTSTSNQCSNEFQFEANHLSDQVQSSLLRTNRSNYRSRLQYTCMDICAIERMDYLALGTNTGSVYVYTRIDSIWIHYCTIIAEELVGFISFLHFFNMKILSYDDEDCDETKTFSSMPSTIISPLNNRSQSKNFDRRESHFDLFLSIGTMKGHLIIVQLNLCQTLRSESAKTSFSKTSQCCETAEHFSDSKESRTNLDEIRSSTYRTVFRSCSFTNDLINLIYFDGFNRLFIADQTGKLFVFGDLRTTLSKWPIDYQNSSNLFVDASLLINLNGVSIFQFDACEDFLVFSTTQSKVYLFDFANKKCFPLGKKSTKQLSTNNRNRYLFLSGVCIEAKSTGARTLQSDTQRQDESIYPIMNGVWNRKIFVTRPKCRIWEIDQNGNIRFTHQLTELTQKSLSESAKIIGDSKNLFQIIPPNLSIKHFERLFLMEYDFEQKFLVTYSTIVFDHKTINSIIFVIDLIEETTVAATPMFLGRIKLIKCLRNQLFVIYSDSNEEESIALKILTLTLHQSKSNIDSVSNDSICLTPKSIDNMEQNLLQITPVSCEKFPSENGIEIQQRDVAINSCQNSLEIHSSYDYLKSLGFDSNSFKQSNANLSSGNKSNTCCCGLPLPRSVSCADSIHNERNKILFRSIANNLTDHQLDKLISMALDSKDWFLYFCLIFFDPRPSLSHLFYFVLLSDTCFLIEQNKTIPESDWMELIEKFSIHLNGSKSQFILNNKAKNQSELCKICALQQDSAKILMFLERSILFPSLYFCTTNYVLKTLSRKAIEVSKSNETLTIEFYRLILFFQLMESSISPRSKMFLESLSESAKTIMNDSYSNSKKNCSIISNANLNELDTKLIAEPKKIVIKNGIDLDQTKKSVSLLDLNRMICGVCDERISSKKIMEKDRRVKYSRQCQHIYHFECYQRAPILRCQFCVIKD